MILLFALACAQEPMPLPPARLSDDRISLRRVRMPGVDALVGRPLDDPTTGAVLLLVDALGAPTRQRVTTLTRERHITLAITSSTTVTRGERYLVGMTGAPQVTTICERARCP